MGRPKKSVPKHVEPEEESQEILEEEPEAEEKTISKAAAVRDALEQGEESPEDGVAYIEKVHGIEMTRQTFSSYKAQQKARDAKKGASKGKPSRKPRQVAESSQAIDGYLAPPPKPAPSGGQPDLIEAMEAMKPLVASLGAEKVKRLVDLLG